MYFVGALSPHHHKGLIEQANEAMTTATINNKSIDCYRARKTIWQLDLTVIVYISEKLRQGQIRGLLANLEKLSTQMNELKETISQPSRKGPKWTEEKLKKKIASIINSHASEKLVGWELAHADGDCFVLDYWLNTSYYNYLTEQWFGRRILISNRHDWPTKEIILAYWGQAKVEYAFKNMKNPFHLAMRPQYHWTDQKIEVHSFICVISFLLGMVAYKEAREKANFKGCPNTLLEMLSKVNLATFIDAPTEKSKGKYKATRCIEEMDDDIQTLAKAMGLIDDKIQKSKISFSVYK